MPFKVKRVPEPPKWLTVEKGEERVEPDIVNVEEEEKPVAEPSTFSSEETHGGRESTDSIEDSPNPSVTPREESEQSKSGGGGGGREQESRESTAGSGVSRGETEDTDSGGSSSEGSEGEGGGESRGGARERTGGRESEGEEGGVGPASSGEDEVDDGEGAGEAGEDDSAGVEDSEAGAEGDAEGETGGSEDSDSGESESSGGEADEGVDDGEEETADQSTSYNYNTQQVVKLNDAGALRSYYQTEFWRFIDLFAENKLKIFDASGYDEYNIRKMMLRQYEKKPPSSYKQSRVKESVVLILDNSGSMAWWASRLKELASLALKRGDVEIYIAPNGYIEEKLTRKGRIPVNHDEVVRSLSGRKIIYVGDYDGADTAVLLSKRNDVVWICPETRYRRFRSHNWVHFDESDFNGVFIRAWNLREMFDALRRVTRFHKLWIDLHEGDRFYDDAFYF